MKNIENIYLCQKAKCFAVENGRHIKLNKKIFDVGTTSIKVFFDDFFKSNELLAEIKDKTYTKDLTIKNNKKRYRANLFHDNRKGWCLSLRELPKSIANWEDLNIKVNDIISISKSTGLTLFCGPTGAGKSTTMCRTILELQQINKLGITITVEDPVEYLFNKDNIFQREVNTDVMSFDKGVYEAMRQCPDTIVIGEIRDKKTALAALKAAFTGHKVLSTLHANSVQDAILRLWAFFDDQDDEILIYALQGIVAQHLIRTDKAYCVYESLCIDDNVKNALLTALRESNNLRMLNNEFYSQQRKTLQNKKDELIKEGVEPSLLQF